jgi:hypothetical protein
MGHLNQRSHSSKFRRLVASAVCFAKLAAFASPRYHVHRSHQSHLFVLASEPEFRMIRGNAWGLMLYNFGLSRKRCH